MVGWSFFEHNADLFAKTTMFFGVRVDISNIKAYNTLYMRFYNINL